MLDVQRLTLSRLTPSRKWEGAGRDCVLPLESVYPGIPGIGGAMPLPRRRAQVSSYGGSACPAEGEDDGQGQGQGQGHRQNHLSMLMYVYGDYDIRKKGHQTIL